MGVKFRNVVISLKTLYNEKGNNLKHGKIIRTIEDGNEYYDLYDLSGELVCMDGEICEIIWKDNHGIRLFNNNGEYDTIFTLTKDELGIGSFEN